MKTIKCSDIAKTINGKLVGARKKTIYNLNRIEFAGEGELTFYSDKKYENYFDSSEATCIIVKNDIAYKPKKNQCFILVDNPYHAFIKIIKLVDFISEEQKKGVHKTAIIGDNTLIDDTVTIGPNCVIGKNCRIEEGVTIEANTAIQDNVQIGKLTKIYPNVTLYKDTEIGQNCIIHSGVVIGADGFGYLEGEDGSFDKIPQIGNVIIMNNVEIGSNTCVDRAVVGSTIIGNGVKIDNLVQIGHNCVIGDNTAIVAQTGLGGSTKIGKGVRLGGQVGLAGHLEITDGVMIAAQSGVNKSVKTKGMYFGSPIKEARRAYKIEAVINQLPELARELNALKSKNKDKS